MNELFSHSLKGMNLESFESKDLQKKVESPSYMNYLGQQDYKSTNNTASYQIPNYLTNNLSYSDTNAYSATTKDNKVLELAGNEMTRTMEVTAGESNINHTTPSHYLSDISLPTYLPPFSVSTLNYPYAVGDGKDKVISDKSHFTENQVPLSNFGNYAQIRSHSRKPTPNEDTFVSVTSVLHNIGDNSKLEAKDNNLKHGEIYEHQPHQELKVEEAANKFKSSYFSSFKPDEAQNLSLGTSAPNVFSYKIDGFKKNDITQEGLDLSIRQVKSQQPFTGSNFDANINFSKDNFASVTGEERIDPFKIDSQSSINSNDRIIKTSFLKPNSSISMSLGCSPKAAFGTGDEYRFNDIIVQSVFPQNSGMGLNLDKIPEIDSTTTTAKNGGYFTQSSNLAGISNHLEIIKLKQKIKGILLVEKVYSHLARKVYRSCFASLASFDNNISCNIDTESVSIDEIESERLKNAAGKYKGITKGRESALEKRLEKSLEKKLETKIDQNLDEKVRGRLRKELMKLFESDLNNTGVANRKREGSQDQCVQTDHSIQASTSAYFDVPYMSEGKERKLQAHNGKMPLNQNLAWRQNLSYEIGQGSPYLATVASAVENVNDAFNFTSPIKKVTHMGNSSLMSSPGKLEEMLYYTPDNNDKLYFLKAVGEEKRSMLYNPRVTDSAKSMHLSRSHDFHIELNKKDALFHSPDDDVSRKLQSFDILHRFLGRKLHSYYKEVLERFRALACGSATTQNSYFLGLYRNSESRYFNPSAILKSSFHDNEVQPMGLNNYSCFLPGVPHYLQPTAGSIPKNDQFKTSPQKQRLSETMTIFGEKASRIPQSLYPMSKEQQIGQLLETLILKRIKVGFYKIQRPYLLQSLKHYHKRSTLNYLLFAKKVEKIYVSKIRATFTKLCLYNATSQPNPRRGLRLKKLVHILDSRLKRNLFTGLRAFSVRKLTLQSKLGKMVSILHQKKLGLLSKAFYVTKGSNSLSKEHMLALITSQLSESRFDQEKAMKIHLAAIVRNILCSRERFEKCHAFYKIKHYSKNSKAALALYAILSKKIWGRMRAGYECITQLGSNRDPNQYVIARKLQRLSEMAKENLRGSFRRLVNYSQNSDSSEPPFNQKKGLLRFCAVFENLRQKALMHGLRMIELYNIYKRNQKSLYINLGLKLWLLFEEKEKAQKKEFFDTLVFILERETYQQRMLEKLFRRAHIKNLSAFFNKFKTEVINLKLNHSIVNLAIKNIIIAVEKINKIVRSKKSLAFRKLNLAIVEKQQLRSSALNHLEKESYSKFKSISSTESIEVFQGVSSEREQDRQLTKLFFTLEKIAKRESFKTIQSFIRMQKLRERLHINGSGIFKKVIYKRVFLAFVQMKYTVDKRRQKANGKKSSVLERVLQRLHRSLLKNKKICFKRWRLWVQTQAKHFTDGIENINKIKKAKFFGKWRRAFNASIMKNTRIQAGLAKIEELSETKFKKFMKLAFKRLNKAIKKVGKTPVSSTRTPTEAKTLKKSTNKVTKAKSPQPKSILDKKESLTKSANKPLATLPSEYTPGGSKKPNNRPNIEDSGVSPLSRFSRALNFSGLKDSTPSSLSASLISNSQASSKMSTPMHTNKTKNR